MPYTKCISTNEPALVILALDRSKSMNGLFGGSKEELIKSVTLAQNVNKVLAEMCLRNTKDIGGRPVVKQRIDVSIIGYGGPIDNPESVRFACEGKLAGREIITLPELASNYLKLESFTHQGTKDQYQMPVWIEPYAIGKTPMGQAFKKAAEVAKKWVAMHKTSFPPIILNFTDGKANDSTVSELKGLAQTLKLIQTNDGNLLLFNCHISSGKGKSCVLPSRAEDVPDDGSARLMFEISSQLPPVMRDLAKGRGFTHITEGAKGFTYNADSTNFIHFLQIGTVGITEKLR